MTLPVALPVPWRAIAAIALVAAVAIAGWRVTAWREGYLQAEAAQDALRRTERLLTTRTAERDVCTSREAIAAQALREAASAAAARAEADRATAQRIENELSTQLAAANARGRDLARRLRDATACPGAGAVPGATPPAGSAAPAAGEPGSAHGIAEATAALAAACDRDSARLAGWQAWWSAVAAGR